MRLRFAKLNQKQIEKLSDISADAGLVSAASVVLPAVLDKFDLVRVLLGTVATVGFWMYSLWLRR